MSSIVQKTTKTETNPTTGVVTETEREQRIRFPKTEDFVMTFTKELGFMKNLSKGEMLVMFGFLKIVNRENELILNKSIKQRIADEFGLKINSMNPLISSMVKKGVILQKERGVYLLNTFIFGKGQWSDIKELRMNIVWNFKEQTKEVSIEQEYLNEEEILKKNLIQMQEQLDIMTEQKKELIEKQNTLPLLIEKDKEER